MYRAIDRDREPGERDRREDPGLRAFPAPGGQDLQGHPEEDDQQDGQHEAGHRDPDDGDTGREVVRPAVVAERCEDPEGDADEHGQRERHEPELDGHPDAAADDVVDGPVHELVGRAEVALQQVADPVDVLERHRIIETVLGVQRRDDVRGERLLARPWAARDGVHQRERDDRDDEEDRDDPQQPADEIPGHGVPRSSCGCRSLVSDEVGSAAWALQRRSAGGAGSRGGTRCVPPVRW